MINSNHILFVLFVLFTVLAAVSGYFLGIEEGFEQGYSIEKDSDCSFLDHLQPYDVASEISKNLNLTVFSNG